MREPGSRLLGLARSLGFVRLEQAILRPAVADLQHEYSLAERGRSRALALARGYWSIVAGVALYATLAPARHLRENWNGLEAPGPTLLRRAAAPAGLVAALCYANVGFMLSTATGEDWRLPPFALPILLTNMVVMVTPPALSAGLGWVLARDRSGSRAVLLIGLLGAAFSFAFFDLAVTRAVHAYRLAAVPTARAAQYYLGSDLGFADLGAAISEDGASAGLAPCPSCSRAAILLRGEWHARLSMPAFAVSFVILAGALARTGRRSVVIVGLWPSYVASIWLLKASVGHALRGDVPIPLASWGAHFLPLSLAGIVFAMTAHRGNTGFDRHPV